MRNYSLLFFVTLISLNIFADIRLSSPQIKLDSQDQRVIEIKIQDANIKDSDIFLNQYKSSEPINEADIMSIVINTTGVLSVGKIEFHNLIGNIEGRIYSDDSYNFKSEKRNGLYFIPQNSIFELKYPNFDIEVTI